MRSTFTLTLRLFAVFAIPTIMPEQLPTDYLASQGFISFQEPALSFTPIFAVLKIDGIAVSAGSTEASKLFADSTFAYLPPGTKIQKLRDSMGREVWSYPIGAEVAHEITFSDVAHTLFELRMIRKITDTQWDFASYSPSLNQDGKSILLRNHYSGTAPFSTNLQMNDNKVSKIELTRINLLSCKNCHFMSSSANYQYPNRDSAGPCGFTPGNDAGISTWIDTFKERFGYSPF